MTFSLRHALKKTFGIFKNTIQKTIGLWCSNKCVKMFGWTKKFIFLFLCFCWKNKTSAKTSKSLEFATTYNFYTVKTISPFKRFWTSNFMGRKSEWTHLLSRLIKWFEDWKKKKIESGVPMDSSEIMCEYFYVFD